MQLLNIGNKKRKNVKEMLNMWVDS